MVALFGDVLRPMKWSVLVVILHSQATKCLLNTFFFLRWWPCVLSGRLYRRGGYVQIGRGGFSLLWKDRLECKRSKLGLKLSSSIFPHFFLFPWSLAGFDHKPVNFLQLVLITRYRKCSPWFDRWYFPTRPYLYISVKYDKQKMWMWLKRSIKPIKL